MSSNVLEIIERIKSLPAEEPLAVREALNRDTEQPVLYGEPLTDEDITESARVTFAALDAAEAEPSLPVGNAGGNMLNSLVRKGAS